MLERLQTAASENVAFFYSASLEKDTERGCIGHLRGYFGSNGKTFWVTWFERLPSLKTLAFRAELDAVVQALKEHGLLQSRSRMHHFCMLHPEARITGAWHSTFMAFVFKRITIGITYGASRIRETTISICTAMSGQSVNVFCEEEAYERSHAI